MKFLVLIAVLAVAWFVWRRPGAAARRGVAAAPPPAPALPQDMVQCPVCAVHLPRGDAVADVQGRLYCSAEHRHAAQR